MCDCDFNAHAETYVADKHVDDFGRIAHANLNASFPSLVPVGQGSTALDFGAGGGNIAFRLSVQGVERVVALDPAENMIKILKRRISEQNIVGVTPFVGTCDDYVRAALDTAQAPHETERYTFPRQALHSMNYKVKYFPVHSYVFLLAEEDGIARDKRCAHMLRNSMENHMFAHISCVWS